MKTRNLSTIFKSFLFGLSFCLAACSGDETALPVDASTAPEALILDDVRAVIADARSIRTPRGIEESLTVEIGGIPQALTVRGRDQRNPILLFIHGGPGVTEMPVSWFYQNPLEDYFTVVQWDQRGSGKTAALNPDFDPANLTAERMYQDGEEVLDYLRERYGKEKIFVLGHSWGSVIGLEIARRKPEALHAYIGMGQVIHMQGNEAVGYRFALEQARARENETAIAELEALAPYPNPEGALDVGAILTQRKWLSEFGGMTWGRPTLDYEYNLRPLSPDYDADDLMADGSSGAVVMALLPQLVSLDLRDVTSLDVPVILFLGRYDYATPSEVAFEWFEALEAPFKQAVWFEHSAHIMQLEQPGRFLTQLISVARPLAVEAGDAAPDDRPGVGP